MTDKMQKLYIITPFKNNDSQNLYKTIKSISNLKLKIRLIHLIVFDKSSKILINQIKKNYKKKFMHEYYFMRFILSLNKGIYNSINVGLDQLNKSNYYIVLGEGDTLQKKGEIKSLSKNKIQLINYKLSHENKIIKKFRNIYGGMPYCHNAIIFKKNDLRYSEKYKICSDYDYLLNYIKNDSVTIKEKNLRVKGLEVIFESKKGISSKSFIRKNIENIAIVIKYKKIKGLFIYFYLFLKKLINKLNN